MLYEQLSELLEKLLRTRPLKLQRRIYQNHKKTKLAQNKELNMKYYKTSYKHKIKMK